MGSNQILNHFKIGQMIQIIGYATFHFIQNDLMIFNICKYCRLQKPVCSRLECLKHWLIEPKDAKKTFFLVWVTEKIHNLLKIPQFYQENFDTENLFWYGSAKLTEPAKLTNSAKLRHMVR